MYKNKVYYLKKKKLKGRAYGPGLKQATGFLETLSCDWGPDPVKRVMSEHLWYCWFLLF